MTRTIAYTVYSEAGGVGKTTLSSNLAYAHTQNGEDVLVIDLDPQDGSISYLLDVSHNRAEGGVDNLVRHLIDRPKGDVEDLIETTAAGFDVIPSHNMLERLTRLLSQAEDMAEQLDGAAADFQREQQLHRVLVDAGIPSQYDVIIVDPPATSGDQLYNAIYATRSLVLPLELSGKGEQSVSGLGQLVDGLEAETGIDVGVLAVVPNGSKLTKDQQAFLDDVEEMGYSVPTVIADRTSLMQGMWAKQCTAFEYVDEHRSRGRDYGVETLEKLDGLADFITQQVRGGAA